MLKTAESCGKLFSLFPPDSVTSGFLSCYAAKLYSHKFLNSCGTGILPVSFIQIKCTTAYYLIS
jgi:hypothetical protein